MRAAVRETSCGSHTNTTQGGCVTGMVFGVSKATQPSGTHGHEPRHFPKVAEHFTEYGLLSMAGGARGYF